MSGGIDPIVIKDIFGLKTGLTFLNHGSYGATPLDILAKQDRFRREIEENPVEALGYNHFEKLKVVKALAAKFVDSPPENVTLVSNATFGVNAALQSLDWQFGEELLVIQHRYPCVASTAEYLRKRFGVVIKIAKLPETAKDSLSLSASILSSATSKTRAAVFDHITSATATVLDVAELCAEFRKRGVVTIIDGAHAPGQVDVKLQAIKPDFYTGNFHKWAFAPRPAAFLYVDSAYLDRIHSPICSNYYGQGFAQEFAWTGTTDPSALYCIPDGFAFHAKLGGVLLRGRNHDLATYAGEKLSKTLNLRPYCEPGSKLHASMIALRLPGDFGKDARALASNWRSLLLAQHNFEVHFTTFDQGDIWLRISAQAYNGSQDIDRLATVLANMREQKTIPF